MKRHVVQRKAAAGMLHRFGYAEGGDVPPMSAEERNGTEQAFEDINAEHERNLDDYSKDAPPLLAHDPQSIAKRQEYRKDYRKTRQDEGAESQYRRKFGEP